MLALPTSNSFHVSFAFDVKDRATGRLIEMALGPGAPIVFATEMEELLAKLSKARAALVGG